MVQGADPVASALQAVDHLVMDLLQTDRRASKVDLRRLDASSL
jgi:hypothetical protein